jgi:hypothetical protein
LRVLALSPIAAWVHIYTAILGVPLQPARGHETRKPRCIMPASAPLWIIRALPDSPRTMLLRESLGSDRDKIARGRDLGPDSRCGRLRHCVLLRPAIKKLKGLGGAGPLCVSPGKMGPKPLSNMGRLRSTGVWKRRRNDGNGGSKGATYPTLPRAGGAAPTPASP